MEISPDTRILSRGGRERFGRGSAELEEANARPHRALRRAKNLSEESTLEARSRGVRLGGENQSSWVANQLAEGVTQSLEVVTLG